jgi:hypothetical protein
MSFSGATRRGGIVAGGGRERLVDALVAPAQALGQQVLVRQQRFLHRVAVGTGEAFLQRGDFGLARGVSG